VEHLPELIVPTLFIHGTKDPFGTPEELTAASGSIPGEVTHVWVEERGHDLRGADAFVASTVAGFLRGLR
jgi:predicted alpha/beta-hydrolase family hydrolase